MQLFIQINIRYQIYEMGVCILLFTIQIQYIKFLQVYNNYNTISNFKIDLSHEHVKIDIILLLLFVI